MTRPSDAQALEALRVLATWLAPAPAAQPVAADLVGPRDVGVGVRSWRAAVRSGALTAVQVGRQYLARREDVDAWLMSRRVQPKPSRQRARAISPEPTSVAERAVARALSEGRLRVAGGRRG